MRYCTWCSMYLYMLWSLWLCEHSYTWKLVTGLECVFALCSFFCKFFHLSRILIGVLPRERLPFLERSHFLELFFIIMVNNVVCNDSPGGFYLRRGNANIRPLCHHVSTWVLKIPTDRLVSQRRCLCKWVYAMRQAKKRCCPALGKTPPCLKLIECG
jgi:hypothetical protein